MLQVWLSGCPKTGIIGCYNQNQDRHAYFSSRAVFLDDDQISRTFVGLNLKADGFRMQDELFRSI